MPEKWPWLFGVGMWRTILPKTIYDDIFPNLEKCLMSISLKTSKSLILMKRDAKLASLLFTFVVVVLVSQELLLSILMTMTQWTKRCSMNVRTWSMDRIFAFENRGRSLHESARPGSSALVMDVIVSHQLIRKQVPENMDADASMDASGDILIVHVTPHFKQDVGTMEWQHN